MKSQPIQNEAETALFAGEAGALTVPQSAHPDFWTFKDPVAASADVVARLRGLGHAGFGGADTPSTWAASSQSQSTTSSHASLGAGGRHGEETHYNDDDLVPAGSRMAHSSLQQRHQLHQLLQQQQQQQEQQQQQQLRQEQRQLQQPPVQLPKSLSGELALSPTNITARQRSHLEESANQVLFEEWKRWQEHHFAWIVSVLLGASGGFVAGAFGCLASHLSMRASRSAHRKRGTACVTDHKSLFCRP